MIVTFSAANNSNGAPLKTRKEGAERPLGIHIYIYICIYNKEEKVCARACVCVCSGHVNRSINIVGGSLPCRRQRVFILFYFFYLNKIGYTELLRLSERAILH